MSLKLRFSLPTTSIERQRNEAWYAQGEPADAIFYLQNGHVKLSVLSDAGKEAVVGILGPGSFFGESCLADRPLRDSSATALTDCLTEKIAKAEMLCALKKQTAFSEFFLSYVLTRKIQLEEDLADQLCNPCEMRLARMLLSLTSFGQSAQSAPVTPRIDQQTLAAMVGTTQARISFFLRRFRERGLVESADGIRVNRSLLEVIRVRDYAILNNAFNETAASIKTADFSEGEK
jgi:CRP/FNR family cyclic AMP-dependent transcriptional regulator